MNDASFYAKFVDLSPFEIKDELMRLAQADTLGPDLPQRRPRQPELDRDPRPRGVLPARPVRADRVEAGL